MLKILYADCRGLSLVISAPFRYFFLGGVMVIRGAAVINVDTPKMLVPSTCYDKQHGFAYL